MAKVTSKGQITIPVSIRRRLSINEGDKLLFIDKPDGVLMVNPDAFQLPAAEQWLDEQELENRNPVFESRNPDYENRNPESERKRKPDAPAEHKAAAIANVQEKEPLNVQEKERLSVPAIEPAKAPEKPRTQIGGLDVAAILDEIRSIGSKI